VTPDTINAVDHVGYTALHYACLHGKEEFAQWLLNDHHAARQASQALPMFDIYTSLVEEARPGMLRPPRLYRVLTPTQLMGLGFDPTQRNVRGESGLHALSQLQGDIGARLAFADHDPLVLRFMKDVVQAHPDLLQAVDNVGRTALHHAVANPSCPRDVVKWFIEQGDEHMLLLTDTKGQTPIHVALDAIRRTPTNETSKRHALQSIVEQLVPRAKGLPMFVRDEDGFFPIHRAAMIDNDTMEVVVSRMVDIQVPAEGRELPVDFQLDAPLCSPAVDTLLNETSSEETTDGQGKIALYYVGSSPSEPTGKVVSGGFQYAVSCLVEHSNVDATDKYGNLPFFCAATNSHAELVFPLLRAAVEKGLSCVFDGNEQARQGVATAQKKRKNADGMPSAAGASKRPKLASSEKTDKEEGSHDEEGKQSPNGNVPG
jgi:ankyrin repeat protein